MTAINTLLTVTASSAVGLGTLPVLAQLPLVGEAIKTGEKIAGMSATAILGTICVLSICLIGYLLRLMFGKLLSALEDNTKASQRVADVIDKCGKDK